MHKSNDKINLFFLLITFASFSFVAGLTLCYLLPQTSYFYQTLENGYSKGLYNFKISFTSIAFALSKELKYYVFILVSLFSSYRERYMIGVLSFRGFLFGTTSACLMRGAKNGGLYINHSFLSAFNFILLSVILVCLLCYACVIATTFSKRLVYPIHPLKVIKRKDTYKFLLDYASLVGIAIIIVLFIMGNYLLMIS